jgi:hypothetical protein
MKVLDLKLPGIALLLLATLTAHANKGDADFERMTSAGGLMLIDWRGDFTAEQKHKIRDWVSSVGETVGLLHGSLPRPEVRMAMQPYPARSAVPFARVLRDQPQGILFYINPDKPLDEFVSDWTAYHEFSHLFIPYPGYDDIWFSEGLASYYQNILQLRGGLLTRDETLERFIAAFKRGEDDDGHAELTLGELSAEMRERRAFMRVYWSGALYFMEADVLLRRQTELTLDDVLREFGECCLQQPGKWTGMRIASEFDRIAGEPLFVPLYERYEQSKAIPDAAPILAAPEMDEILSAGEEIETLAVE